MTVMKPFWETKTIEEMTIEEWESLCDGCGICCLHKIEDIDTNRIYYTDVACQLLNIEVCQCLDYSNRSKIVSDCLQLTPKAIRENNWLPNSCAYRRLAEGKGLAWWHPLVSGNSNEVKKICSGLFGKVFPEKSIDPTEIEEHIVDWFEDDDMV